jgi:hypothetical protein
MLFKKTFVLILMTSFLEAKSYKITNLTPHKKINIITVMEGHACKKQSSDFSIDQKESEEIHVSRRCPLTTITIVPLLDVPKIFSLTVDKLDDTIETIAIKQSPDGYKLTYY